MTYPTVRILKGRDRRLRGGSPWIFANEVRLDDDSKALASGSPVRVMAPNGMILGVAHFNAHSLIACRMLSRNKDAEVDQTFLARRLERALALRERLFDTPFYRLCHAEADGLPGLVVDRYGDALVVQINSAGMQLMEAEILAALQAVMRPSSVILRNDSPVRLLEGLENETRLVSGEMPAELTIQENGLPFQVSLETGQKTGWFFDQRDNRQFIQRFARDARVLDLYSHSGGFALNALAGGARTALAVDRSASALELAKASAGLQGMDAGMSCERAEVFEAIETFTGEKRRFDVVIADPPAFVRSKKDLAVGLRGYRKLARGAAGLVAEQGFLAISCCSHNVSMEQFGAEVWAGIKTAGRGGRLLHSAGAGPDHPVHPALPETAYLKFLAYALD